MEVKLFYINISSAATFTGWSERTFWRRFADGSISQKEDKGSNRKAMVLLESIVPHSCIPIDTEGVEIIMAADGGDVEAQTDLALIFHSNRKFVECIWWLELAANLGYAPAMRWLSMSYATGEGVSFDENLAIMWLAKAAALGDQIAKSQMQNIRNRL